VLDHHITYGDRLVLAFLADVVYTSNRIGANLYDTNAFGEKDG
jgi:hypothetical protein